MMNNDFPAEEEIKKIEKPIVIIHSVDDKQVPFELGQKLYEASNKSSTQFWEIDGKHVGGMETYKDAYVSKFMELFNQK